MHKKVDKTSLVLALLPIIGIYSIAGINISNFMLIMLVIYGGYKCIFENKRIKILLIDRILICFFLYIIFFSLINLSQSLCIDLIDIITKYVHLLCFISIISVFRRGLFNKGLFINYFLNVALVSSCFLIIQFVLYNYATIKLYGVLSAYRTNITDDLTRPSAFFVEPAHFCRYCCLPLYYLIFKDNSDRRVLKIIIISFAILISKSSIGYITIGVICILWIMRHIRNRRLNFSSAIKGMLIVIPSIILAFVLSFKYRLFDFVSEHVAGLNMKEITSGNVRVFRGIFIWKQEDMISKIFGVGFANVKTYLISNRIRTIFDGMLETGNEYMSALTYILVMGGVAGTTIFLLALGIVFYRGKHNRILVLLFLILMASNEEFMTIDFINIWLFLLVSLDFVKDNSVENSYMTMIKLE